MRFTLLCGVLGFFTFANGFVLKSKVTELETVFAENNIDVYDLANKGQCGCTREGCWCIGVDDNLSVHVILSVDEVRHCRNKKTIIDALFIVGTKHFSKLFPADRFEDFCHEVDDKRFCFRIDVNDTHSKTLSGCMTVSRPQKLDLGCFQLPLLTDECSEDESFESDDSVEDGDDNDFDVVLDPVTDIEPYESDDLGSDLEFDIDLDDEECVDCGKKHCECMEEQGCHCEGKDDGLKVSVDLSVDEVDHGDHKHTYIVGSFEVGDVHFSELFPVNKLEDFCKTVSGKEFCFKVEVEDTGKCNHLHGCIGLTKPKVVDLGCFRLPLLTEESDDDSDDVLVFGPYD